MGQPDVVRMADKVHGCVAACIAETNNNDSSSIEVGSDFVVVGMNRFAGESLDALDGWHLGSLYLQSDAEDNLVDLHLHLLLLVAVNLDHS